MENFVNNKDVQNAFKEVHKSRHHSSKRDIKGKNGRIQPGFEPS